MLGTGRPVRLLVLHHQPPPSPPQLHPCAPSPPCFPFTTATQPCALCPLQERERRGESWQPRWFKPLPADAEIIQVSTEELANILLPFGQAGWFHFLSERRWSG